MADHYTTAQGIIDDFGANPIRAKNRYFSKRWRIEDFRVDTITGRFIGMGEEPSELRLIFKDDRVETNIEKGMSLNATCEGHANRGGHIVFKNCHLLSAEMQDDATDGHAKKAATEDPTGSNADSEDSDAPRPRPPNLPERAAGSGWYCIKSLDAEHTSTCFRTQDQCDVGRGRLLQGGARYTGCAQQNRAACFTYFDILRDDETFDCSATIGACERQREYAATQMKSDVRDVSACGAFD